MTATASWWQTVLLAVIGAIIPFGVTLSTGGTVSAKTVIASAVTAALTAIANILRSPRENPPTMIQKGTGTGE